MKLRVIVSSAEKDMGALTGIARCEREFCSSFIKDKDIKITSVNDIEMPFFILKWLFFVLSFLGINTKSRKKEIYHFMSQQLAYSLAFMPMPYFTIITVFDLFQILPDKKGDFTLWERIKHKVMRNKILKADRLLTISECVKSELIEYFKICPEKIDVIYEAVDHDVFKQIQADKTQILKKYNIPLNKKIILFVGSEQPRKNFVCLLNAFVVLQKQRDDVVIVKIGKSQWPLAREQHLKLLEKIGIKDKVFFTDFVSEQDLVEFYNIADVLSAPTLKEGGFALPILEAMACGCPVIVSDIPVLKETVAYGGIYINPNDHIQLAQSINNIINDKENAKLYIAKGVKRSKEFTWKQSSDKIYEVYREAKNL
ncbi:glycosyltransferase family 4 protein [bacterium]|nr:glycosyltransferase family 4 protein [bacterium]